ncbi:MAG: hypothetical protein AAF713_17040 [Pseudomonadota bacterium]
MQDQGPKAIEGEVLEDRTPDPAASDVTPGWIGRNREHIERGRQLSRALIIVAPPPARLALAAVSVAADGLLLADDLRRRDLEPGAGGVKAGSIVLEGLALAAMSRFAPTALARNLVAIETARTALNRLGQRA